MSARPVVQFDRFNALSKEEKVARNKARSHYIEVHEVARTARDELFAAVMGNDPPITGAPRARLVRLAQAYSWSSRTLWLAAQAVCDIENLPNDGAAEGIVWEVKL